MAQKAKKRPNYVGPDTVLGHEIWTAFAENGRLEMGMLRTSLWILRLFSGPEAPGP